MNKVVNILSEGPISYNGRAFLQPIILNKDQLLEYSIEVNLIYELKNDISDCDLLIVDSKFFRGWWQTRKQDLLDKLAELNQDTNVVFFDTSDSAGYLLGEVLPFVNAYYKHQTLVDKSYYLKPMYGRRLFTDYYHNHNNISDIHSFEEKDIQVIQNADLDKIRVFWNTGLANYSFLGDYLGKIYRKFPIKGILRYPKNFTKPSSNRPLDVQCRFGVSYNKETVAFQRKSIAKILKDRLQTEKVNRYKFYRELKQSKVVISPFGLGEITLKDFEVFLTGSLLMKPYMDHMNTWPNFYTEETFIPFKWNLKNISTKLENILDNYQDFIEIAENGQEIYRYHIATSEGNIEFLERFRDIVFYEAK